MIRRRLLERRLRQRNRREEKEEEIGRHLPSTLVMIARNRESLVTIIRKRLAHQEMDTEKQKLVRRREVRVLTIGDP